MTLCFAGGVFPVIDLELPRPPTRPAPVGWRSRRVGSRSEGTHSKKTHECTPSVAREWVTPPRWLRGHYFVDIPTFCPHTGLVRSCADGSVAPTGAHGAGARPAVETERKSVRRRELSANQVCQISFMGYIYFYCMIPVVYEYTAMCQHDFFPGYFYFSPPAAGLVSHSRLRGTQGARVYTTA